MKLYYMPGACSLATHIVLQWTGVLYETRRLSHDELKKDDYLSINPLGAVPTLVLDDGSALTQNAAILGYLADSFPAAKLAGDGTPKGHAEVDRWLGFVNSDIHPAFKPLFGATGYLADEAVIEKTKSHAKETLHNLFGLVNARLKGRDWIASTRSIADPYLFVMVRWAHATKIDLSDLPEVERFYRNMQGDPAVGKALKDEGLA